MDIDASVAMSERVALLPSHSFARELSALAGMPVGESPNALAPITRTTAVRL
jgi:hypothetical protein